MKNPTIASAFVVAAILAEPSEGAVSRNFGTFVEDFDESCADIFVAWEVYGSCCSFSGINEDGKKCRLTIAGEGNGCGRDNRQYMENCMNSEEGCVAGPYISVTYGDSPAEQCPESQYDLDGNEWSERTASPPPSPDVHTGMGESTAGPADVTDVANNDPSSASVLKSAFIALIVASVLAKAKLD